MIYVHSKYGFALSVQRAGRRGWRVKLSDPTGGYHGARFTMHAPRGFDAQRMEDALTALGAYSAMMGEMFAHVLTREYAEPPSGSDASKRALRLLPRPRNWRPGPADGRRPGAPTAALFRISRQRKTS